MLVYVQIEYRAQIDSNVETFGNNRNENVEADQGSHTKKSYVFI